MCLSILTFSWPVLHSHPYERGKLRFETKQTGITKKSEWIIFKTCLADKSSDTLALCQRSGDVDLSNTNLTRRWGWQMNDLTQIKESHCKGDPSTFVPALAFWTWIRRHPAACHLPNWTLSETTLSQGFSSPWFPGLSLPILLSWQDEKASGWFFLDLCSI